MSTSISYALASAAFLTTIWWLYSRYARQGIDDLPGPPSDSWLYGNFPKILQGEVGEYESGWRRQYGRVFKIRGPLGQNMLLISDPKALQYVFQTRAYSFVKAPERQALIKGSSGPGLAAVEGEVHKRQRRVMLPAFGVPESRAFVPVFMKCAAQMVNKWQDIFSSSNSDSIVVNVPYWTSRATLDAIGEAAFDYRFGALECSDNELSNAFQSMAVDSFASPSNVAVLVLALMRLIPEYILNWLVGKMPGKRLESIRRTGELAKNVAKQLVAEKKAALLDGQISKDILGLCVRANLSQNSRGKLLEDEMLAQLQIVTIAGHETTSTAVSWTFYELAKQPVIQNKLRIEVGSKRREKQSRGESEWSWKDFEEMPYLNAVMKEVLRFHSPVGSIFRVPIEDEILPLLEPISTAAGEVLHELPVPKGTTILASIATYNRDPSIFGGDADLFNPDRWLDSSPKNQSQFEHSSVGVISNMMTFGAGARSCVGWRFAVLEMQAFIVEMISNFHFEHDLDPKLIRRENALIMAPVVRGEVDKGAQLPLRITRVTQE